MKRNALKNMFYKQAFFYLLLFFLPAAYAQDTLLYNDGRVWLVNHVNPDTAGDVLHCVRDGKTIAIPLKELSRFSIGENWFIVDKQGTISGPVKESGYDLGSDFFREPVKGETGRFSISTNMISPFVDTWGLDYSYYNYSYSSENYFYTDHNTQERMRMTFASNRTFSIEPMIQLTPKWAVKVPLIAGLRPRFDENVVQHEDLWGLVGSSAFAYVESPFGVYQMPEFNAIGYIQPSVHESGSFYFNQFSYRLHAKNLLFQAGIAPRIYPMGTTKNALFLSQSFNIGIADQYALDIYADFDTTTLTYGDNWILARQEIFVKSSPFVYFRYEASAGIDLVSKSGLFLSLEGGFSTMIKNHGDPDRYFIKVLDGEYQQVHEAVFDFGEDTRHEWPVYAFGRINLGFRFGQPVNAQKK